MTRPDGLRTLAPAMPLDAALPARLRDLLGAEAVLTAPEDIIPYAFDGTAVLRQMPGCVALPRNTEQVAAVLRLASVVSPK